MYSEGGGGSGGGGGGQGSRPSWGGVGTASVQGASPSIIHICVCQHNDGRNF